MRTDKLAVLAIILGVGYLMFKQKGASQAQPAMPAPVAVYRPSVKVYRPPIRVYHPPIRVYHPPRQKIHIIFRPPITWLPILHRRFPNPIPRPPILSRFPHPLPKRRFFR